MPISESGIVGGNGGASGPARGTNYRRNRPRLNDNQAATTTHTFEGCVLLLKEFYYDVANEAHHDQFSQTTKKMAVVMGSGWKYIRPVNGVHQVESCHASPHRGTC